MLKAVLFDFNGVIINDEPIHKALITEILVGENLCLSDAEFSEVCLGRSDKICLDALFSRHGRVVSENYLNNLIKKKAQKYREQLENLETLPIYPGIQDLLINIKGRGLHLGLVTGAVRSETEFVLKNVGLADYFEVLVAGDDLCVSKPSPEGYLRAIEQLNNLEQFSKISAVNCLAIEDTPAGIKAAKAAGIQVVGIANTYPFHFMQRLANWAIDYLSELELDRIERAFVGSA